MKKYFVLLFSVLSFQIFSQPHNFRRPDFHNSPSNKLIYTQTIILPGDSVSSIYYLFKMPYKNLVFTKNDNEYNAEFRVDIEITDSNSNFVSREIKNWKIKAQTFEQTDSPEIYSEGFISLNLISGSYTIQPIVTDLNSNREFILKSEDLDIHSKVRLLPLIVESKKSTCNGKETFELTNFEGNIPFSPASYDLIIPVKDIGTESIDVAVISDKDTIVSKKITKSFISSIGFEECSDKIVISNSNKIKTRNFILSGFSRKLREGPFTIIVNKDKKNEFHTLVFWYNKPMSLRNPEIAIKSLKHLANESVVDSLLDYDDEIQYEELVKFWKKKDPTPETEYNELMAEYYNRVDYAQMNFSSLTGIRGVDTDRGMIFIKFGKPDQVDRTSNENGKIVETWLYKKNQRKFVFIDRQGVGEFSLKSS